MFVVSRTIRAVATAALATTLLAGPLAFATAQAEVVYNRGNSGEPETLDPHKTSIVQEGNINRDMFEGLVINDAKGEIAPGVATSWTVDGTGTVYTFKLRANAKWSNGEPVKASDFVYSIRRLMNPATGAKYATVLYPVKGAEAANKGTGKLEDIGYKAIDDTTLEVTLESPTPYFLQLLTHQTGMPVPPGTVDKFGPDWVKVENIVSNGPYMAKEVVPASHIRLVKNPHFHAADTVKIDAVVFFPTEDRASALRRFQAGELHSNDDIPTEQTKYIKETLGSKFHVAPYLGTYYYAVNTKKGPLGDKRVRQALSLVIDREFLAEEIWGGTMVPAYSFVPPGIDNYEGGPAYVDWKEKSPLEREDMAKALLKQAGYGPGGRPLKVEIRYNTSENHKKTSVALADMWKPLGVEVTYVNADAKTHYAVLRDKGDFDIARAAWIADYSDPQNFLFLFQTDNPGFNYSNWSNPDFDKLMKSAERESDLKKRADILKKAEAIFLEEQPSLSLMYYGSKNLVSDKLSGWQDNILDIHPTRFLELKP